MKRVPDVTPLRWGILGAARITRKMVPAIQSTGAQVVAIAASRLGRAQDAADTYGIPRAYEGYERLLADSEVEAIYLPLANGLHREWLMATANSGRSCLCEKPLVLSAGDARAVRDRFAAADCRLQEAFMWRHHPQVAWLDEKLVAGRLGELRRLQATFSFNLDRPDDYRWSAAMGGGALWDIGCYGVNAARYFFHREPVAASFRASFSSGAGGVDETAAGWVDFGGGRVATISCSFTSAFAQRIELIGSEGRACVERPWLAVDMPAPVTTERANKPATREFGPTNSYRTMIEHFTRAVRDPSSDLWPAEDGVSQAAVMEGIVTSARQGGAVWVGSGAH